MATVNIGSLKFNWKGTYNGSTAYAIDDVTEYNGSSYICILASTGNLPTNTTYFQPMATGGTDLSTTLTTQGDILYRDGSGLQRLAAGTANQVLQTGGSGANPSWVTASGGKTLQVVRQVFSNNAAISSGNLNGTTFADYPSNVEIAITPTSPTSIIKIEKMFHYYVNNGGGTNWNHLYEKLVYKYSTSSPTSYSNIPTAKGNGGLNSTSLGGHFGAVVAADHSGQSHNFWQHTKPYVVMFHDHDTPAGETLTYKVQVRSAHAGSSVNWYVNRNVSGSPDNAPGIIILTEMDI